MRFGLLWKPLVEAVAVDVVEEVFSGVKLNIPLALQPHVDKIEK